MFQTRFTWWLLIVSLAVVVSIAEGGRKLRGIRPGQFDDLKQKVTNTQMRDTVRGKKTNRELSHQGNTNNEEQQNDAVPVKKGTVVRKEPENNDKERSLQTTGGGRIVKFYTMYDEFGPSVSTMGQTAGLNGMIYDAEGLEDDLNDSNVIGALKGSCSVVSTKDDHLCTFEMLIAEGDGLDFGTIIASGAMEYKTGSGGFLIVEAAGDAYNGYNSGILSLTYESIGMDTILMGELSLS